MLELQLPAGLTDDMRDVAFCLYEAMAIVDCRAGNPRPGQAWLEVLRNMARVVVLQLQHLAQEKGGRTLYLSKCAVFQLSAREMCRKFRGDYVPLADEYGLTVMRVRQIVDAWQREQFLERQAQLPGMQD